MFSAIFSEFIALLTNFSVVIDKSFIMLVSILSSANSLSTTSLDNLESVTFLSTNIASVILLSSSNLCSISSLIFFSVIDLSTIFSVVIDKSFIMLVSILSSANSLSITSFASLIKVTAPSIIFSVLTELSFGIFPSATCNLVISHHAFKYCSFRQKGLVNGL